LTRQLSENSIFNLLAETDDPIPQHDFGSEVKIEPDNESMNVVTNIFQLNGVIGSRSVMVDTEKMTIQEMKTELRSRGLSTAGTKKEVLRRLEHCLEETTGTVDKKTKSYQTRPLSRPYWLNAKKQEKGSRDLKIFSYR